MKVTTVEAAYDWILSEKGKQPRQGLDKIYQALALVGNPHENLEVIHVTGTNGKGSTIAFLKRLLLSQKLTVGTFTSPHIMTFRERFTFNDQIISKEEMIDLTNQMITINQQMAKTKYGRLTFFELYTVMAALFFKQKNPDVCLIEVGIGGLNDSTNIFNAQTSVISSISIDHIDKLGVTAGEIAYQKAGIIKENSQVITGPITNPAALKEIQEKVTEVNANWSQFKKQYCISDITVTETKETQFTFQNQAIKEQFTLQLLGKYQTENAAVALQTFFMWMKEKGFPYDFDNLRNAIYKTQWMARMELLHLSPAVYIDGAHNPAGLLALRQTIDDYFANNDLTILYAGLTTKNQKTQLEILKRFPADEIIISEFSHMQAMSEKEFNQLLNEERHLMDDRFMYVHDWQSYIKKYIKSYRGSPNRLLLITGSLYFVSDVRLFLLMNK